jgi:hypothetical protein
MIPTVASASSFRDDLMDQLLQCCQEREASENVPHKPKFDFEDISTAGAKPHEKMFRFGVCLFIKCFQGAIRSIRIRW